MAGGYAADITDIVDIQSSTVIASRQLLRPVSVSAPEPGT
jgi:hypothetical protein